MTPAALRASTLKCLIDSGPFITTIGGVAPVANLLLKIKPEFWKNDFFADVAAKIFEHITAGRNFGILSLEASVPGDYRVIRNAEPIENVVVGLEQVLRDALGAIVFQILKAGSERIREEGATHAASWVTAHLSRALAGGSEYFHVDKIASIVEARERVMETPGNVVPLHPELNRFLRWGGLAMNQLEGETALILGRSSSGKTALALECVLSIAKGGHPVSYNVLGDASAEQIFERMVYAKAGIPLKDEGEIMPLNAILPMKKRGGVVLREKETLRERLEWAQAEIRKLNIDINDHGNLDQYGLRLRLHQAAVKGVKLSVWDNLDHFRWDRSEQALERRDQLGTLVYEIRQFDKAHSHTSLILAQANRASEDNKDSIPMGHNCQDSDQPKNHVTLGIGIHNPNLDGSSTFEDLKAFAWKTRAARVGPFQLPYRLLNPDLGDL